MFFALVNNMHLSRLLWVGLMVIFGLSHCRAFTNELDVSAINSFYAALGSPPLPGWVPTGGDPCAEGWQGVQCIGSNITGIVINGANLGGELGDGLVNFASIETIDLSNNNIGGSIPENLPITLQRFFLSANQFTGSIPSSLSKLTLLTDMSVNNNHLSGDLPDAFSSLTGLINLDLSFNNLSGELPPSMGSLSSLTTLRVQNNQLSGMLNVLEDLPIKDLNIENNLFSGPVPEQLLNIPILKKDGNPFNTSIAPSLAPPQSSPPVPLSEAPIPDAKHANSSDTPSSQGNPQTVKKRSMSTVKVVGYVLASVILVIVIVLTVIFCLSKYQERKTQHDDLFKSQVGLGRPERRSKQPKNEEHRQETNNKISEVVKEEHKGKNEEHGPDMTVADRFHSSQIGLGRLGRRFKEPKNEEHFQETNNKTHEENRKEIKKEQGPGMTVAAVPINSKKEKECIIDVEESDVIVMPPPLPWEKVIVNPIVPSANIVVCSPERMNTPLTSATSPPTAETTPPTSATSPPTAETTPPTSATSFSVADLQQCTKSFSEENLIREGRLGQVYLAEAPDEKLLEVMKLDKLSSTIPLDDFLELVLNVSELRHPNILELVGYSVEFDQRLLVYKHFSRKTLQEILHGEDDFKTKLSWSVRLEVAVGAAKALEYLHESCQPALVHQNFGPANLLLDDNLAVCVTECGLSSLISSNSVTQLSDRMSAMYSYEAPEINESRQYTDRSDVYSFGVVMLELLTGRKPYDSTRPCSEQHLVRWASSQLYDIDALSRMVDPSLSEKYSEKSLSCFADIISRCVQQEPEFRPPISAIIQDLTRMVEDLKGTRDEGIDLV